MSEQDKPNWFEEKAFFRSLLDLVPTPIFVTDHEVRILFSNMRGHDLLLWSPKLNKGDRCGDLIHCCHALQSESGCGTAEHCKECPIRRAVRDAYIQKKLIRTKAYLPVVRDGRDESFFYLVTAAPFQYENQMFALLTLEEISDLVDSEEAKEMLKWKAKELEYANLTINMLLQEKTEEKVRIQENLTLNVTKLLLPLIERLKKTNLTKLQEAYLSLIGATIREITSPFYRTLSGRYYGLTPMETQVANLVKTGKTTKEIAAVLGTSVRAIEYHRHNIRKKIDISKTKNRLKSELSKIG